MAVMAAKQLLWSPGLAKAVIRAQSRAYAGIGLPRPGKASETVAHTLNCQTVDG